MEMNKFMIRTLNKLKKRYEECEYNNEVFTITKGMVEVQIPLTQMYQHFNEYDNYNEFFRVYMDEIDELLHQNEYKVNYEMVFPLVRNIDDFKGNEELFYSKPLFENIGLYFGEDCGAMFRIIAKNDKVDFDKLYECSMENLNKLVNPLSKLHDNLEVYCLKYNSDLASSMILNESTERSIIKLFGLNFVFAIPAASTLLIAPSTEGYVSILQELIKTEKDPNRITDKIIEFNKGVYQYVG